MVLTFSDDDGFGSNGVTFVGVDGVTDDESSLFPNSALETIGLTTERRDSDEVEVFPEIDKPGAATTLLDITGFCEEPEAKRITEEATPCGDTIVVLGGCGAMLRRVTCFGAGGEAMGDGI